MLLLVGSLLYFSFAVFNMVFLTAAHEFNLVLLASAVLQLVIFYFSRFKGQFFVMSLLFLMVAIVFVLPANWFYNAGSAGPTLLLYLIATFYLYFLLAEHPRARYLFMVLVLFIPAVLVFSEPVTQDWIASYPTEQTRQLDIWVSYIATVGMSVFIMKMYAKRFRLEREKSERLAQQLKILAETDSLTRLYNRSAFSRLYDTIEDKTAYSLAILDLDHFKLLNDTFGHQVGDSALVAFARQLETLNERGDVIFARYGGEEFLALFKRPLAQAFEALDNFRATLEVRDPQAKRLTFSAGVVAIEPDETVASAIHRADIQLYKAKAAGRNQACK